jgi:hypothetical protein
MEQSISTEDKETITIKAFSDVPIDSGRFIAYFNQTLRQMMMCLKTLDWLKPLFTNNFSH